LNLDDYTFGVEVEFTGTTRSTAARAVAEVLHSSVSFDGGCYNAYSIRDSRGRIWKVMRDSSVASERKVNGRIVSAGDEYKCEFVTPILRYTDDMELLQEIIRAIRKVKGHVNSSCGLHVHIGAGRHTPRSLRNLVNIFKSKQDMLYKAIAVKPNRTNYCKKLEDEFVDRVNKHKPQTTEAFADDVYKNYGGYDSNRNIHYSSARYFGINFHSYYTKGTVEFRLFNSTLHAGWVRTFVILSIAMNNQAICQSNASAKVTTSTNECFTFRTWLLRMGFIGDVYEVPRKLLLEKLEGNKAWRYGEPTGEIIRPNER